MTPMYIFDLDGTLALIDHRRHLVNGTCPTCHGSGRETPASADSRVVHEDADSVTLAIDTADHSQPVCSACGGSGQVKPDWSAFFAACVYDSPNWPVIATMNMLLKAGADVRVWSGRSSVVMNETLTWLHRFFEVDADEVQLLMRCEGDYTPDEQLKAKWLDELNEYDRNRLVAVFDDRQKVVDMWRAKGVACFQVAPGEF